MHAQALFAPLWKTRYLLFLVVPCVVGICILWEHTLNFRLLILGTPLDY
jgi:hypothetical protein